MRMKKLSKIKLHDAVVLENRVMKVIFGGSGSAGNCCSYSNSSSGSNFTCINGGGSPTEAEFMAGSGGWWACNSSVVKSTCGC